MNNYQEIFKNKVIGVVGSVSSGKTTTLLEMIEFSKQYKADKVCYFYHTEYKERVEGVRFINSLEDLEMVRDSFIFVDEFLELFKLNDRHSTEIVKRVLFQIEHNNNILVLAGLPEYYKKFVSSFVRAWVLHRLNFAELINGSSLARYIKNLSGDFIGGTCINLLTGEWFSGNQIHKTEYRAKNDKKSSNNNLFELAETTKV